MKRRKGEGKNGKESQKGRGMGGKQKKKKKKEIEKGNGKLGKGEKRKDWILSSEMACQKQGYPLILLLQTT